MRKTTIRQAMGWLLAATLVPLAIGSAALFGMEFRAQRQVTEERLFDLAQAVMQTVDRDIASGQAQIETLAWAPSIDAHDWRAFRDFAADVVRDRPGALIVVTDSSGQQLLNTALPWGEPLPNLWQLDAERREAEWLGERLPFSSQGLTKAVFQKKAPAFSDLYYAINLKRPTLAIAVPVIRQGRVPYTITLSLPPQSLQRLLEQVKAEEALRIVLVDRKDRVVATNKPDKLQVGESIQPIAMAPGAGQGTFESSARDDVNMVGAYAVSGLNGFVLRVSVPRTAVYASAVNNATAWAVLLLAVLVVSGSAAAALRRRIVGPLAELAGAASRHESIDATRGASGLVEIDALRDALSRMAAVEGQRHEEAARRQAAEQLRAEADRSEQRMRRMLDSLFSFVGVLQLDGRVLEVNRRPIEAAGLVREDVIGRPFWDCHWWNFDAKVQDEVKSAVRRAAAGETVRYDAVVQVQHGRLITMDFQIAPVCDESGAIVSLIPSGVDITDRVHALGAMRESEGRARAAADVAEAERRLLDAIFDAVPAGIMVADSRGALVRMNRANRRVWGDAPIGDVVGGYQAWQGWQGWWADGSPRQGQRVQPSEWPLAAALRGEARPADIVEIQPFGAHQKRRTLLVSSAPVRGAGGAVVGGVVAQVDITERVAAERALRESEERFRALADNIPQIAWIADAQGVLFWFNQRWFDFTGQTIESAAGRGWQAVHHPDHVERVSRKFREHVRRAEPWEDTFPMRRHDGEYRWFLSRAVPIVGDGGRVARWFGTNTDVTDQRSTEKALRESEERLLAREVALREVDRQKDEFLATLAHELRNPLSPIRTAAHLIKLRKPADAAIVRARETIERQNVHLTRLVDDLLDVARINSGSVVLQRESVDVAEIVAHAIDLAHPALDQAGHRLDVSVPSGTLVVHADKTRIAQSLSNLLHNAAKFTTSPATIALRVERHDDWVTMRVNDPGEGIAPENLERIFQMFVQESPSGQGGNRGLGIGLALSRKLVQLHNGLVLATSEGKGRGSTFEIRLPLAPSMARGDDSGARAVSASSSTEVLVVDDNADAADLLKLLLEESAGHAVHVAYNGRSAIEAYRVHRPKAVLLDIGLPDMTGYEVALRIREIAAPAHPLLVALTGWGQNQDKQRSREAGFDHHMTKPANPDELIRLLSAMSAGPPPPQA